MKKAPFIITLTGDSGSGKSFVMERILELANELCQDDCAFKPVPFQKYTTREYRAGEIAKRQKGEFCDVISADSLPPELDLVYRTYGKEYGFYQRYSKDIARGFCRK